MSSISNTGRGFLALESPTSKPQADTSSSSSSEDAKMNSMQRLTKLMQECLEKRFPYRSSAVDLGLGYIISDLLPFFEHPEYLPDGVEFNDNLILEVGKLHHILSYEGPVNTALFTYYVRLVHQVLVGTSTPTFSPTLVAFAKRSYLTHSEYHNALWQDSPRGEGCKNIETQILAQAKADGLYPIIQNDDKDAVAKAASACASENTSESTICHLIETLEAKLKEMEEANKHLYDRNVKLVNEINDLKAENRRLTNDKTAIKEQLAIIIKSL